MSETPHHKSILKATRIFGFAQLLQMEVQVITTKVVANILGPSGIGLVGMLQNVMQLILTAVGFDLLKVGTREIALNSSEPMKYQKITEGYKAEGEAFMAANKNKPGIKTTASGLQYQVIKEGKGPKPGRDARVKMSYIGMNPDGSIFDQSPAGEGISFGLNEVIPGWTEGVQLMSVGSKIRLFVPQELGYAGNPPQGANIKPYSPLVFEMELMEIESIKLASKLTGYDIDVYRDNEEEIDDVNLEEFSDEIDAWVIEQFKAVGLDTAKSVLELSKKELLSRTDLEEETIDDVLEVLRAEFSDED